MRGNLPKAVRNCSSDSEILSSSSDRVLEWELTGDVGRSLVACRVKLVSMKPLLSLLFGLVECWGLVMVLEYLADVLAKAVDVLILSDVWGNMIGANLRMNLRYSRSHAPSETRWSPWRLRMISSRSIFSKVSFNIIPILKSIYIYIMFILN